MNRQTLSQRTALKAWIASGAIYADECAPPPIYQPVNSIWPRWVSLTMWIAACALACVPAVIFWWPF